MSADVEGLFESAYNELRAIAAARFRDLNSARGLEPTSLVHEAFLKVTKRGDLRVSDRGHFVAIAAGAMRQILIDSIRRATAAKRSAAGVRIALDELSVSGDSARVDLLALEDALCELAKLNTRHCKIAELRFLGGLTIRETAEVLGVSTDTVKDEWRVARSWLLHQLTRQQGEAARREAE